MIAPGLRCGFSAGGAKLVMNKGCNPGTEIKLTLLKAPILKQRDLRSAQWREQGPLGVGGGVYRYIRRERDNIVNYLYQEVTAAQGVDERTSIQPFTWAW